MTIPPIHLHFHLGAQDESIEALTAEVAALRRENMASNAQLIARLNEADEATNNIAGDIDRIKAQLEGGLSAEAAAEVQGRLDGLVAQLQGVAAGTPEDAAPEPEPPVEP